MRFIWHQYVKQLLGGKKRINADLFKQAEWLFLQYLIPPLAQLLENVYTPLCVAGLAH